MKWKYVFVCLLLTGCGEGYYPREVYLERDVLGGCAKSKFTCPEPMILKSSSNRTPVCVMPDKPA